MKSLGLTLPPSKEFVEIALRAVGWHWLSVEGEHRGEDYFAMSKTHPIFCVADGVTLDLKEGQEYPNPSGPGETARIFCETFVAEAEKQFDSLRDENSLIPVFRKANAAVGEWNRKNGRTREAINFKDIDLFAATVAFAVVKDHSVFWGALCDSRIAHITPHAAAFMSSEGWGMLRRNLPDDYDAKSKDEQKTLVRSTYRNGVDDAGAPIGYGVATGEAAAELYLETGSFTLADGDSLLLLTDGFEEYLKDERFIEIVKKFPEDAEKRIATLSSIMTAEDSNRFGRERTLILAKI